MIKKKAFAKLNLNLHVLPQKNISGCHSINLINTELDLYDELIFEPLRSEIKVICNYKGMPKQEDNLVYKAAKLLQKISSKKEGVKITIKKNIPIRVGLGGGSSDAAVTINTLCKLWKISLTKKQKINLADTLGKDVPYSLFGGLAEVKGEGDKIISLPFDIPEFWLILIIPKDKKPSTGWMYNQADGVRIGNNLNLLSKIKQAIKTKNINNFLNSIFNDFEQAVEKHFPIYSTMKQDLQDSGALKTLLCGSGLSMAGFFTNKAEACQAQKLLTNKYEKILISKIN
jgi:4-diphosphocytidyl-2-C-methyl-D-erythritol kinase